jgi:hypothetical protein
VSRLQRAQEAEQAGRLAEAARWYRRAADHSKWPGRARRLRAAADRCDLASLEQGAIGGFQVPGVVHNVSREVAEAVAARWGRAVEPWAGQDSA